MKLFQGLLWNISYLTEKVNAMDKEVGDEIQRPNVCVILVEVVSTFI